MSYLLQIKKGKLQGFERMISTIKVRRYASTQSKSKNGKASRGWEAFSLGNDDLAKRGYVERWPQAENRR